MKNKKAQVFEQGLVIAVFSICVIALILFLSYNQKEAISLSSIYPAISIYSEQKEIAFYAKESGKLAVQESFYETLKNIGKECASSPENINYAIWARGCLPSNDKIKETFLSNVDRVMQSLGVNPKSVTPNDEKILFTFNPVQLNSSAENIHINYSSDISFDINLTSNSINLNFADIYNQILDQWARCNKGDIISAKSCMNGMKIKGWTLSIRNDDFFCDLVSKESFYTQGGFQLIIIKLRLVK
jgi:hypothetical protein